MGGKLEACWGMGIEFMREPREVKGWRAKPRVEVEDNGECIVGASRANSNLPMSNRGL